MLNYIQCMLRFVFGFRMLSPLGLIRLNLSNSFDLPIIEFRKLHFHTYHGVCYARSLCETIYYKLSLFTTLLLKRNSVRENITTVILFII